MLKPSRGQSRLGPSIPTKGSLGYTVDKETGIACKMLRPDATPSLYLTEREPNSVTKKYKGVFWSKRTSKREFPFVKNEVPSPNTYNIDKKETTLRDMLKKCALSSKRSIQTKDYRRYFERVVYEAVRSNIPGPGYYNVQNHSIRPLSRFTTSEALSLRGKKIPLSCNRNQSNASTLESTSQNKCTQKVTISKNPSFNK